MTGVIVRETNWAGPCITLGPLQRETAKFWVYGHNIKDPRRIAKSNPKIHLEPCKRCEDHPQTNYPNGYEG